MTDNSQQVLAWKTHTISYNIGYDKLKDSKNWSSNFYFVVGADPQLGYNTSFQDREPTDWQEEMNRSITAVEKINALTPRPQFVVICGDLVNAMPNKEEKLNELQVKDFKKVYSKLHPSISLVCVCGNHDVGDVPDKQSITKYRSEFGHDYFSFWCGGVLFLVLNSQYYKMNKVEEMAKEQEQWLKEQLTKHKGQRIILFQHIPWFLKDINEEDQYFNINKQLRKEMIEKFFEAGVTHIFYGHCHRNYRVFYKDLEMITTNAIGNPLGNEPPGLRIVKVYQNNMTHTYFPFEKLPSFVNV
ncbi:serine/threonine-protein phosphatase CPPED1-like [Adelges cooleyi]|uniref:serine/threonine-protein phosphatase CPPED1-like n=1 Tax=Adelges cooleyi TaxID=133065 RepID=UPI00217FB3EE|nr:serine/threonine-protein phosphatase CPPED1-like [Adelges cooleyi]XP_050440371.1 serine/threonine-protein phosphatase CPPED1-like [Adelges cooleyi]